MEVAEVLVQRLVATDSNKELDQARRSNTFSKIKTYKY